MMASAAVTRSPTTERLYSLYHKKNTIRISVKPKNLTHSSWKPKNNSHTSLEPRNSTHTPREPHTSGKPRSYTLTSLEPTSSPHTPWQPRNSPHPPRGSHASGKPRSYTLTPWEPSNFTSTPGKPENSTHISGKPRSVPDLNPLQTPTKESDQQKEDGASIREIRHPSKSRNSLGYVGTHQQESIHQEKNTEQTPKAIVSLDVMFEKENHNCINESLAIPPTAKAKDLGKKGKSVGKHFFQKCYTCGNMVKDVDFEEHLFFGETECTRCHWKISSCEAFRENKIDLIMGNATCLHTLTYCMTPSEYISNKISQESAVELDRSKLTSYVCSLNRLKGSDPWKKAIDQCQDFLDGETSQLSETNEHLNALETVHSLPEESVPTSKYEMKNSPWFVHDHELILSQPYDLEHLNDVVEFETAKDYPEVRMERSPVLFTESSGENMSTGLPHCQTDIDTCSGNLVRDVASQSTSLSDMTGMVGSMNSTRLQKGRKKKRKTKCAKQSKSKSGFSRLQANSDAEKSFIETPANGYYLIVRQAIEECPMCYTEFCPSRFTVNINTYLLTTVCTGCALTVYIIVDPPDGSAPNIFIETESDPPEKRKKCATKRKDTGHEGRPHVKKIKS
ncbi:uncharacterized protein LOC125034011 isoform X2 [Penaeus chinensis]|uniref:uncharacterized protein LOC125034011 isoform X2 n=1 Tax=Penaeus chinensis TaxID=139456 RepID=UPI001FB6CC8A|nr:uncharacterized protein LOC125034011 isoform X2 [Penaeus chinensis]